MALGKSSNPSEKIDSAITHGHSHGSTFFDHGCEGCSRRQQATALGIQLLSLQGLSAATVFLSGAMTSSRAVTFANC
jgi:hypothetical protein